MERVVVVVVSVTTLAAYAAGSSADAAVYSGLFWGVLAWGVLWVAARLRRVRQP